MTAYSQKFSKAWMPPVPCTERLAALLQTNGISLSAESSKHLTLRLLEVLKPGDAPAAKEALNALQHHLRHERHDLSRRNAENALAAFLGTLGWKERLRQMTKAPEPVSIPERTPVTWFRENDRTWARFVYKITSKKEGPVLTPKELGHLLPERMRMRFLTRARPTANGIVANWRSQQEQNLPPILAGRARQREALYRERAESPNPMGQGFEFTQYVIAEIPVHDELDGFEGEFILQRKLRSLHTHILRSDRLARAVELRPVGPEEVAGYEDLTSNPAGLVRQWPIISRGWRELTRKGESFDTFVDLDVRRGRTSQERDIGCLRYGMVSGAHLAPRRTLVASLFASRSRPPTQSWQDILSSAPVNEAIHTATRGLLLTQLGGDLVRFAPWNYHNSFMVDAGTWDDVCALTNELAVQAKTDGLGVCLVNHESRHTRWFAEMAPESVVRLDSTSPRSLNPLSGIQTEEELEELLPSLCLILYELAGIREDSAHEELASCIRRAWNLHGERLELAHIAYLFRPYGKPAVRALQATLDHLAERADAWLAGPCSIDLFAQDLCLDIAGIRDEYARPFPLAGIVQQLVMALVYRRALGLRSDQGVSQLTLLVPNNQLAPSHRFCTSLLNHCHALGTCLGYLPTHSVVGIYDLNVTFEDKRSSMPVLIPGLAQDSHRAYVQILWPEEFARLPTTQALKDVKGLPFAVLQHHQLQGYFMLEQPGNAKNSTN